MPEQPFYNPDQDFAQQIDDLRRRCAVLERLVTQSPGAIQTWVPTLAQGVTNNIAKTVNWAYYSIVGPWVLADFYLQPTGVGTIGAAITLTLPLPVKDEGSALANSLGVGWIYDGSFWRSLISCWSHKDGGDTAAIGATGGPHNFAIAASGWHMAGTIRYRS
jgi:hypothetical protein